MFDALWTDLRLAARGLRQAPGFSAVVTLTFALAIGANTTVFSLLNAVVLRALPVHHPDRLVTISVTDSRTSQPEYIYLDTFKAFRDDQQSFSGLSMYSGGSVYRVEARGTALDVGVEGVMPAYFDLLGARAAAGRLLTGADEANAGTPAVVIGNRLRQRLFGSDPRAVGETLKVDGQEMAIVGVTAPGFMGLQVDGGADIFVPISAMRTLAGGRGPVRARNLVGRLAPGVAIEAARAEVLGHWPAIARSTAPPSLSPAERSALASPTVAVESLRAGFSTLRRQYGPSIVVLVALTAILLAMGCVNVTGLVLARSFGRRHQLAVRLALGAGRARLFQQMLVEGLLLAIGGMALALPLAWWASRTLATMLSAARVSPLLRPMTPDARVLLVTLVVTAGTGLIVGVLPAWRSARTPLDSALRPGRTVAGSLGRSARLLLVAQIALAMVLLVAAGLFAGTLSDLRANDNNVHAGRVLFTKPARNPGDRGTLGRAYWRELTRQLSQMPGAGRASLSVYFPAFLGYRGALAVDTFAPASRASDTAGGLTELVSPGFFDTYGITRLQGRDFTWDDDAGTPQVAIVNASAARTLFPSGDAVGQRLRIRSRSQVTEAAIVGIVADAPMGSIREPHRAVVFRPILQDPVGGRYPLVHVRVSGDLGAARDGYVRVVQSLGHHYVRGLFTFDEWTDFALLQERLIAGLAACAAALAALLGCLGLYGLLAYAVNTRAREIGVRMALGATRSHIVWIIVRDGLALAVAGILIGIPCAIAAARLARSALYGLAPGDPLTIASAALAFIFTALVATSLPARRASRIDPMDALRHE